jgi:hypothetical protein
LFTEVGHDSGPLLEDKHRDYRRYYTKELEKEEEVMPDCPFMHQPIYRTAVAGNDARENTTVIAGHFKGLVQVYNKERREVRESRMRDGLEAMEKQIKDIYKEQLNKGFKFDFGRLDDKKNTKEAYSELKALLIECGLGVLKLDEFISNFKF